MEVAPTLSTAPEYAKVEQSVGGPSVDLDILDETYRVDEIAKHILHFDYKNPCLQFPDALIRDSALLASHLQEKVDRKVYVMADTSYSPCCVDEVAAQHVNGDVVFHFGNACLNPTRQIPTVYVRRKTPNPDLEKLKPFFDGKKNIVLYPDIGLTELALALADSFADDKRNIVVAMPYSDTAAFIPEIPYNSGESQRSPDIPNRVLTESISDLSEFDFIYLTDDPSESLLMHWSTVFSSIDVVNGHGDKLTMNTALRKRYRYVQSAKAAGTVGILVNTLSLRDTATLLQRTKEAITKAEKKYYTFVVGKPNVAKLGNFEAIDVWVVLGCPQGGVIIDDSEYFKPIVTPYELELAFNDEWTGKWLLAFDQVWHSGEPNTEKTEATKDEKEPLFDLVTGKFVFGNAPLREVADLSLNSEDVQKSSNALAIRNTVSTAAMKLQQRTWQGLGSDHADITEEYADLKKGRSGIARNYQEIGSEKSNSEDA